VDKLKKWILEKKHTHTHPNKLLGIEKLPIFLSFFLFFFFFCFFFFFFFSPRLHLIFSSMSRSCQAKFTAKKRSQIPETDSPPSSSLLRQVITLEFLLNIGGFLRRVPLIPFLIYAIRFYCLKLIHCIEKAKVGNCNEDSQKFLG